MSDKLPEKIGKYRVLRELGRGATSHVYLAEDAFRNREVAIKVVRSAHATDTDLSRRYKRVFMNEAALAGRLNHPHIVAIYDAASDDEMSYLVMERVDGGTLDQYCTPDALLPLERLVEIVFKATIALDYAHRQGVIHCDIKPANILIAGETDIKISDFGAAYFGNAEHTFLTGVGSPAYMSPEQIQERQVTHQTDIYSLGVVMYQMLTGRLPFQGSSRGSLLYQIVNIDAVPPSVIRPMLPPELDRIVLKAMAKSLTERYATWMDFSRDLAQAFKHLTVPQHSASDTEKFTALRGLAFFQDFRDVDLWEALRMARWERKSAGDVILEEGTVHEGFFVVACGAIEILRGGRMLDRGEPGHCFGNILYFEDVPQPRTTTVRAAEECDLLAVRAVDLQVSSESLQMQFNRAFIRLLVHRLEHREERLLAEWPEEKAEAA